ncbi:MAG: hypothetical protein SX243_00005 [Acidobacteriota bacterium]|nr:hypothetical protein [Acidobacteriota bacterium]
MKTYPLLFAYRDLVPGSGFIAGVEIFGRALLEEEEDSAWMYGLNPGGIAGGGVTAREAMSDFRRGYVSVLEDIASVATGFKDFQEQVAQFFWESTEALDREWEAARTEVRERRLEKEGLQKHPFSEDQIRLEVREFKQEARPAKTRVPREELAA